MLVGLYHHESADEIAGLGLYGYNATLAAIALFLWRRIVASAIAGYPDLRPDHRVFPSDWATDLDSSVRAGDLARSRTALARGRLFGPSAPRSAPLIIYTGAGHASSARRPFLCHDEDYHWESCSCITPQERDKLLIFVAARVARARKERGLKLQRPRIHRIHHGGADGTGSGRQVRRRDHDRAGRKSSRKAM